MGDAMEAFTIQPARYAKKMMAVSCPSEGGYKSRAARLAHSMARGRYTHRERAYLMSQSRARDFEKLYALGWDAGYDGTLEAPHALECHECAEPCFELYDVRNRKVTR
jgi:hypothetical protein